MKRFTRLVCAVVAVGLFIVMPASAQSVSGAFRVASEQGTQTMEFSATGFSNGSASGDILFTGPVDIPDQDVDGDGSGEKGFKGDLTLKVVVDSLSVEGSRAVVAGQIRDASNDDFIGFRVLLTVEDGAANEKETADAWTLGIYRSTEPTWIASDAELKEDPGVGMTWHASDFEQENDRGYEMPLSTLITSQSFPPSSYELAELAKESGDIVVKQ